MVKRLSTMWETWVRSLGWEVPWRRKWQPTPVLLPRKSHGRRSLVSMGLQRVGHDWATSLPLPIIEIGSHNYGGLEIARSTLCKLENQESQCCLWVWRPENWKMDDPRLSSEAQEPRASMSEGKRRWMSPLKHKEQIYFSFAILFYSGPQWLGDPPRH